MNIVQLQEQLKNFSQEQLVREMQSPSGNAPQFLVLGEIMRRQKMQQDAAQQNAAAPQSTVAEDAIAAAGVPQGGLADMARALAPKTNMAESTGVQALAQGGAVKKMATGDKIVRGGKILVEQEDGTYRDEQGRAVRNVSEDLIAVPSDLATAMDIRTGEQERTWAQRNIGDSLRSFFQPVGEAGRAIGQPVGETLRSVGQPVGEVARGVGAAVMADAPRFVLGPIPAEAPTPSAPEYDPALARPGRFEPVGDGLGLDMLPPEVDPAYFARRAIEARPLSEILTPQVLSREEAQSEIQAMAERDAALAAGAELGAPELQNPAIRRAVATPPERAADTPNRDRQDTPAVKPPATPDAEDSTVSTKGDAPASTASTASASSSGGIAGVGGMSSYEQELMDALQRREKAAEQDKWLALAQVGLNMMSSTQPTLLGAVGEAGLKGVEAARTARDQYDKDRLELLGAIEQSRMARAAAAAKAARGASSGGIGGLKLKDYLGVLKTSADVAVDQLNLVTGGMDPVQAIAMAQESGDNARALEIKSAYDQALAAQGEYRSAVNYIGGAGATPVEDDDLSFDAADE